jgi:hypothetical protein
MSMKRRKRFLRELSHLRQDVGEEKNACNDENYSMNRVMGKYVVPTSSGSFPTQRLSNTQNNYSAFIDNAITASSVDDEDSTINLQHSLVSSESKSKGNIHPPNNTLLDESLLLTYNECILLEQKLQRISHKYHRREVSHLDDLGYNDDDYHNCAKMVAAATIAIDNNGSEPLYYHGSLAATARVIQTPSEEEHNICGVGRS